MANPTTKLTVAKNGTIQQCQTYLVEKDGTPNDGSALKVNNNGVDCFIGLLPIDDPNTYFNTPLIAKKDGVEYYVQTEVVRYVVLNVPETENQKIKLSYVAFPTKEDASQEGKDGFSVKAVEGTPYTIEVIPDDGYKAGEISPASGNADEDISFSVTPAEEDVMTITITQTPNQTIVVTANGEEHTETFTAEKDTEWTAKVVPALGYAAGTLSAVGGTLIADVEVSATEATRLEGTFGAGVYFDKATNTQAVSNKILPSVTKPDVEVGIACDGLITNLETDIISDNIQWCAFELNIPNYVTKMMVTTNVGWDDSTKGSYKNSRMATSSGIWITNGEGDKTSVWRANSAMSAGSFESIVGGFESRYCTEGSMRYLIADVTPGATYKIVLRNSPVTEHDSNKPGWNFVFGDGVEACTSVRDITASEQATTTISVTGDYDASFEHIYSPDGNLSTKKTIKSGDEIAIPSGSVFTTDGWVNSWLTYDVLLIAAGSITISTGSAEGPEGESGGGVV